MRALAIIFLLLSTQSCTDRAFGGKPTPTEGGAGLVAPSAGSPVPLPEDLVRSEEAQSPGGQRVLDLVLRLRDSVKKTSYQGPTQVREKEGYYAWDCSGMSNWILKRTAPKARRALSKKPRPVARDYYKAIDRAPLNRFRKGWKKLPHVSDARPGDLFAWLRSPASKSKITGHVGFLVSTPTPHPKHPNAYMARVVDATSLPHGDDTRAPGEGGGFGFGTLMFVTDDGGETIAYGWHGERSLEWGFMPAKVIYGRVNK